MTLTREQETQLRDAIGKHIPPVHCNGCDEWLCEHRKGEDKIALETIFNDVAELIARW